METLLMLALIAVAAVVVGRFQIAARGQRTVEEPAAPTPPPGRRLPFRPSGQVFRALRAARPTEVRSQHLMETENGPR
ncbi:hypothetical protein [Cryptosporangium minutisporangium]|uniref:Uncharacterized protein n=1 Tax=Cryptosporangium minutisporangium TaxID=113569 RepID=A0ABP6SZS5_9ACTN